MIHGEVVRNRGFPNEHENAFLLSLRLSAPLRASGSVELIFSLRLSVYPFCKREIGFEVRVNPSAIQFDAFPIPFAAAANQVIPFANRAEAFANRFIASAN